MNRIKDKLYWMVDGIRYLAALLVLIYIVSGCSADMSVKSDSVNATKIETIAETLNIVNRETNNTAKDNVNISDIPEYSGEPYVVVNNNEPAFKKEEITDKSFEQYSSLDSLGRCGIAVASVGKDIMPDKKRGAIGQVKPSGWHTVKYDFVEGKYLYNRCHLLGYQLTGENANEKNLITGTRYLNVDGMLPFEDMVADYIKETDNHVMYRVTPIYKGNNLLASGVEMEGYSVEDQGAGICFHVYCYNAQPGIEIDYATGDSSLSGNIADNNTNAETNAVNSADESTEKNTGTLNDSSKEYVLNMNTLKFHLPSCSSVKSMSNSNKGTYTGNREELIEQGYEPCKICNP